MCDIYVFVYPDRGRFPRQCHQWQCHSSRMHPVLLQTQSEMARNAVSGLRTVSDVHHQFVAEDNSVRSFRAVLQQQIPAFSSTPTFFPTLA